MKRTSAPRTAASKLPPVCYIRHINTGEIVLIHRGQDGYLPNETQCSPACLNAKLPQPPSVDEIAAMRHGALMGWDTPGCDPEMWRRTREVRR